MRRYLRLLAFLSIAAAGLVWALTGETDLDPSDRVVPIRWISEAEVLVDPGDAEMIWTPQTGAMRAPVGDLDAWEARPDLAPFKIPASWIARQKGQNYVRIDGQHVDLSDRWWGQRHYGYNQRFPSQPRLSVKTYRHLGKTGLVAAENGKPVLIELPKVVKHAAKAFVTWDAHAAQFFSYQPTCARISDKECLRNAWFLDTELQVLRTIALPSDDLLSQRERFSCFSCGCGCYTQETFYAVGGKIYVHIAGWPLPMRRRGLFEAVEAADGAWRWRQIIRGRIEPLLVFSPSGCRVAYLAVRRTGADLGVTELCDPA